MRRLLLATLMLAALPVAAQPAPEREDIPTQPRQKIVTVFGTETCPKSSDPDEIVVCRRRPEEEQFRLPPLIREEQNIARRDDVRETRAALVDQQIAGGRCSDVGSMGQVGCSQGLNIVGAAKKAYDAARGEVELPEEAPR